MKYFWKPIFLGISRRQEPSGKCRVSAGFESSADEIIQLMVSLRTCYISIKSVGHSSYFLPDSVILNYDKTQNLNILVYNTHSLGFWNVESLFDINF